MEARFRRDHDQRRHPARSPARKCDAPYRPGGDARRPRGRGAQHRGVRPRPRRPRRAPRCSRTWRATAPGSSSRSRRAAATSPPSSSARAGWARWCWCSDHDIERKVAVKRLLPEMTDPAVLARFVDEIRTVGRLEHPNIVPIHDVGVDELGRYFFVMKYVEGETLESIIEKLAAGRPGVRGPLLHRGRASSSSSACSTPSSTPTRRASSTATSSPPT